MRWKSATGLTLFHRDLAGYRLTTTGRELLAVSRPALPLFQQILTKVEDLARHDAEHIRLTGPAETINHWVYPILNRFRQAHPDVVMEVDTSEAQVDLHSGEFDIAVRLTDEIEDERLIARRIAAVPWGGVLLSGLRGPDTARRATSAKRRGMTWCITRTGWRGGYTRSDGLAPILMKPASNCGSVRCREWLTALKSEGAIGILPKVVGDNTPELVPCFRHDELRHNCWVVAAPEAYRRPLVRACMRQIGEEFPRDSL